jgi:hypothetical protein
LEGNRNFSRADECPRAFAALEQITDKDISNMAGGTGDEFQGRLREGIVNITPQLIVGHVCSVAVPVRFIVYGYNSNHGRT